jgi:hypothetical protein
MKVLQGEFFIPELLLAIPGVISAGSAKRKGAGKQMCLVLIKLLGTHASLAKVVRRHNLFL